MDELDLLKSHWQKDGVEDKRYKTSDLYPMLLKKSSSIVKTLFYISIAEMIFWIIINTLPFMMSQSYRDKLEIIYGNDIFLTTLAIISWIIIPVFVYLLYKSYKSISVTDNAKKLMANIIKTRKVIKYYVIYNLVLVFISMCYAMYIVMHNDPDLVAKLEAFEQNKLIGVYIGMMIVIAVSMLIIWLFYRLIYGILLRRLNKNYKELKKLEV